MAQSFGKTWWGNEWLRALTHIDYANRIPRGATYARRGAVVKMEIQANVILAKVSGSRRTPYKIKITIPAFDKKQIDRLIDELVQHPVLISKLLNRELSPEVSDICNRIGLNIFPQRWDDLEMGCSCPDWAVPCKHLAAVIYMMSREIDNDPFLVFKIHGMDLMAELQKRGIGINDGLNTVQRTRDLFCTLTAKEIKNVYIADFHRIDVSHLNDIALSLVGLLQQSPVFYPYGDFRNVYQKDILHIQKNAQRILDRKIEANFGKINSETDRIQKSDKVSLQIDEDLNVEQNYTQYDDSKSSSHLVKENFIDALLHIPEDYLTDYDQTVVVMHQSVMCALHLVANGAITPKIVCDSSDKYSICWLPATIDKETARVVQSLNEIIPLEMLTIYNGSKKNKMLTNRTECLLMWLLNMIIPSLTTTIRDDIFQELFFKGKKYSFEGIGETTIPGSIRSWLERFYISQRAFSPSLIINETEEGFVLDIAINENEEKVMFRDFMTNKRFAGKQMVALKELSLLSEFIRNLDQYIDSNGAQPIYFTRSEFAPFLLDAIPMMRLLGVKVFLPMSLKELIRPKISVRLAKKKTDGVSYLRLDELLCFDWQIALGDELITPEEFFRLTKHASGLIQFKQTYFYINETDILKISKTLSDKQVLDKTQLLQVALTESYDGAHVELTDEVQQLIRQLTNQEDIAVPKSINATLRPYQQRGYQWLYKNMMIGFGSIIADDMGLGKTLQVIAFLQKMKDDGCLSDKHALVVVPTGLIVNWQSELHRFAPQLSVFVYHGQKRSLQQFNADILLTTYGVMRTDATMLRKLPWRIAVIDEAQNIKNATTAQSKAVRSISADTHVAMSGTPIENRMSEFWSIMDFANSGYLGSIKTFLKKYAMPIQNEGDLNVAERFKRLTAPFLLRRLKTDKTIISDLPDKIEQDEWVPLTDSQVALYHQTLDSAMNIIEGIENDNPQALFKRQGLVLQMILALKQICNHPALFLKNDEWEVKQSGKTELLMTLLDGIVESNQKVIIFTQFKEMGKMLQQMISERIGETPLFLHGGCNIKQRQTMVNRFQQNQHTDHIFLLSLKAAGTGLNLTAASHVIHYDLWWNPAVEAQATDRAYRIGQHQNVLVRRFITKNTFEERINKMIQDKRYIADMTVGIGENWIGKLNNKELRELFE